MHKTPYLYARIRNSTKKVVFFSKMDCVYQVFMFINIKNSPYIVGSSD